MQKCIWCIKCIFARHQPTEGIGKQKHYILRSKMLRRVLFDKKETLIIVTFNNATRAFFYYLCVDFALQNSSAMFLLRKKKIFTELNVKSRYSLSYIFFLFFIRYCLIVLCFLFGKMQCFYCLHFACICFLTFCKAKCNENLVFALQKLRLFYFT